MWWLSKYDRIWEGQHERQSSPAKDKDRFTLPVHSFTQLRTRATNVFLSTAFLSHERGACHKWTKKNLLTWSVVKDWSSNTATERHIHSLLIINPWLHSKQAVFTCCVDRSDYKIHVLSIPKFTHTVRGAYIVFINRTHQKQARHCHILFLHTTTLLNCTAENPHPTTCSRYLGLTPCMHGAISTPWLEKSYNYVRLLVSLHPSSQCYYSSHAQLPTRRMIHHRHHRRRRTGERGLHPPALLYAIRSTSEHLLHLQTPYCTAYSYPIRQRDDLSHPFIALPLPVRR